MDIVGEHPGIADHSQPGNVILSPPGNQALTENNFSVQSDVTDVRSNGTLQHQFVSFLIIRISSVKIESNPTKRKPSNVKDAVSRY